MKYNVYAVRDIKTGFLTPTLDQNDVSAARNFEHAVLNNRDSLFFSHPEDYALFCVGSFDTDSGELLPQLPVEVLSAANVMAMALSKRVKEVEPLGEG